MHYFQNLLKFVPANNHSPKVAQYARMVLHHSGVPISIFIIIHDLYNRAIGGGAAGAAGSAPLFVPSI